MSGTGPRRVVAGFLVGDAGRATLRILSAAIEVRLLQEFLVGGLVVLSITQLVAASYAEYTSVHKRKRAACEPLLHKSV